MARLIKVAVGLLGAAIPLCSAQTYTTCNPTKNSTCPSDAGLKSYTFSSDFTQGKSAHQNWTTTAGSVSYGTSGIEFTINEKGDAPTIETDFYFFFGVAEVKMKAANGTGIVSSVVLESDDLDEIDWEFLGGDTTQVETNYFGKGNTTTYDRATYYPVSTPQDTFHTYTVNWTSSSIVWLIDGEAVRTLNYADANSGQNFPQTPMRLKLGIWAGGDSDNSEGTIEWAGGDTVYADGPFTMYVESVSITNYNPAAQYTYGDTSGSYDTIKLSNTTLSSSSSIRSTSSFMQGVNASVSTTSSASATSATAAASSSSSASVTAGRPYEGSAWYGLVFALLGSAALTVF